MVNEFNELSNGLCPTPFVLVLFFCLLDDDDDVDDDDDDAPFNVVFDVVDVVPLVEVVDEDVVEVFDFFDLFFGEPTTDEGVWVVGVWSSDGLLIGLFTLLLRLGDNCDCCKVVGWFCC